MNKSLICPNCGCIGRVPEHMEQIIREQGLCEMCGSSTYIYDGEVEPFFFPGQEEGKEKDG